MNVIDKKLSEITPYDNNPRENAEAVSKVAESIRQFGFQQPIVVDQKGVIIAGHTRYLAAQELGLEEVPVVVANLSEEKAKAYRLADNRVAEYSYWDYDKLEQELNALGEADLDFDMENLGFDIPDDAFTEDDVTDVTTDADGNGEGNAENGNDGNENGEEFEPISENLQTKNRCPMCGYEW